MKYQVITIFPEIFESFTKVGLVSKAIESGAISLDMIQLRDFRVNDYGQVDDSPYGGGSGMVMRIEPAVSAIEAARKNDPRAKVVLFTPRGETFNRELAGKIASQCKDNKHGLILLCGRYEGVDERICENWVDYEISLGDYVLMGGEVPAMAFIEATSRLLPGVLGNPESLVSESFESGLLEYPQYTKPQEFRGYEVPKVLLSGHHAEIETWRKERAIEDTRKRRPDLIEKYEAPLFEHAPKNMYVALIHYPVLNKQKEVVTTSLTNLDIHDIARSASTYGLSKYYIVHPTKAIRRLGQKICEHWLEGFGATYNANRSEAIKVISIVPSFDDVLIDIEERTGKLPKIISTSARPTELTVGYEALRKEVLSTEDPYLILLGTGWGLSPEIRVRADVHLGPISGYTDYNHLSVRSASAIIFDRLFGRK